MARSMDIEVSVALNFVISYLYSKLPRRRVDMFGEELEKAVRKKFEGHWYPEKPFKGSAYRCIKASGEKVDPVMETAAAMSGLDIDEVKDNLPLDLSVWIDPNEVSYRIGEKGVVKLLYSNKNNLNSSSASHASDEGSLDGLDSEIQSANRGFNPDAQCFRPIDSLSSSLSNLSMSPSPTGNIYNPQPNGGQGVQAPTPAPVSRTSYLNRSSLMNTGFTAATFAQTKFGSTKLKTQAKRPTRLSPTEFSAYMRQKGSMHMPLPGVPNYGPAIASLLPSPGSARAPPIPRTNSLSPRDPRLDLLEYQQRLMYMQHQQQQQQQQLPSPSGLPSPPMGGGSLGDLYGTYSPQQSQQQSASSLLGGLGGSHSDLLSNPISSSLNITLQQLQQQQLQQQLQQQQLQQQQLSQQQQQQQPQEFLNHQLPQQPQQKQHLQQPEEQQQHPHSSGLGLSAISANPSNTSSRAPFLQNNATTPSPDENKAFLDGLNLNTLPPYQNLQHLLVAN